MISWYCTSLNLILRPCQKKLYDCENCFHFVKLLLLGNGQVIVYHYGYINISIRFIVKLFSFLRKNYVLKPCIFVNFCKHFNKNSWHRKSNVQNQKWIQNAVNQCWLPVWLYYPFYYPIYIKKINEVINDFQKFYNHQKINSLSEF